MSKLTVTEALAEIRTIKKRLPKLRESVGKFVVQIAQARDPHRDLDGGSAEYVRRERQRISDLERRYLELRLAIQRSNLSTEIGFLTSSGVGYSSSVAEALLWKNDLVEGQKTFLAGLAKIVEFGRTKAKSGGGRTVAADQADEAGDADVLVHLDEAELLEEIDRVEEILGLIDGKVTLLNSTTTIEVGE